MIEHYWVRTSWNAYDEVHYLRVAGVLTNDTKADYGPVTVTCAIYDALTGCIMKQTEASMRDLPAGEQWQFTCEPGVYIDRALPTRQKYHYKLVGVKTPRKRNMNAAHSRGGRQRGAL